MTDTVTLECTIRFRFKLKRADFSPNDMMDGGPVTSQRIAALNEAASRDDFGILEDAMHEADEMTVTVAPAEQESTR